MSDLAVTERLQPSLLDRLTDLQPFEKTERREERVIDVQELRKIIERDLSWLLNTNNSSHLIDESAYPNVSNSTANYGLREVAGEYSTAERVELIRNSILKAIERFEPRIRKGSAEVRLRSGEVSQGTVISFDIVADMWAQPLPLEMYLRSEVDVTTGELTLERVV